MTDYVKNFNEQVANSDESRKPLKESMKNWLRVYKYPEVERTTYDRYECTAEDYCLVSLLKERKRYSRPHKIYGNSRGC